MAGCSADIQRRTLKQSRIFLLAPDPHGCGLKDSFYGRECQLMELDNATKEVSGTVTPYYAWNRFSGELCFVGQTEATPDIPTPTLRFYELCEPGIPLPWTLGRCMIVVAINHGLCKSAGNLMNGWGQYAEVYGLVPTSINGGRRSSYNGEDDEISVEVNTRQVFMYQIGPMEFSPIDVTGDSCTNAGDLTFDDAVFNCSVGCGGVDCGCVQPCDDGTQTFYIPAHCAGSAQNMIAHSINGGEQIHHILLPPATGGGTATDYPKIAIVNNVLYVTAYENPPELFSAPLDEYGHPTTWASIAVLTGPGGVPTAGTPAAMAADGDNVHILIRDAVGGSRFYTQSSSFNAADGPRRTFPITADATELTACSGEVIVGGLTGALFRSTNQGSSFSAMVGPTGVAAQITAVGINDAYVWVGYADGQKWYTVDGGSNWKQLSIAGASAQVNDINFVNSSLGWIADDDGLHNTWFGGTKPNHWTNQSPRIANFPPDFTPTKIVTPPCAPAWLKVNTVLMIGKNAAGESVAYMGRTKISGV